MSRISHYVVALAFSIFVNTFILAQFLAYAVEYFGQSSSYTYNGNPYTIYAVLAWPFVAGLGYYLLTSDKRLAFPVLVQLGTVAISAFIVLADSIQSPRSLIALYSYQTYVYNFALVLGVIFALLVVFGMIQVLGMRVMLGLETREKPDKVCFSVSIALADLSNLFDERFLASHALRKRKSEITGATVFLRRTPAAEEVVFAFASKDAETSVLSFSALDEYFLYVKKSVFTKTIMDGLIQSIKERIHFVYPDKTFTDEPSFGDLASLAADAYSLRKTKTSFTRARTILGKVRQRVSISVSDIPNLKYALGFGAVIAGMMVVVGVLNAPNLVEIEVILILGLLLDLGFPIVQARNERKQG